MSTFYVFSMITLFHFIVLYGLYLVWLILQNIYFCGFSLTPKYKKLRISINSANQILQAFHPTLYYKVVPKFILKFTITVFFTVISYYLLCCYSSKGLTLETNLISFSFWLIILLSFFTTIQYLIARHLYFFFGEKR